MFDESSGKRIAMLEGHRGGVFAVALTRDGKTIVSSDAHAIELWDVPEHEDN